MTLLEPSVPLAGRPAPFDPDAGPGTPEDVAQIVAVEDLEAMAEALAWSRSFLARPNPDIGRKGPVCPYIGHALDERLLYMGCRTDTSCDGDGLREAMRRAKAWFTDLRARTPKPKRHLVTVLIVLPRVDSVLFLVPIDELHADLKNEFVESGLMLGQFHPLCVSPGLWSPEFRPLRSPVPLFAIREMISSDLPFLIGRETHADTYFERFAPAIPAHTRRFLVKHLVHGSATCPAAMPAGSERDVDDER